MRARPPILPPGSKVHPQPLEAHRSVPGRCQRNPEGPTPLFSPAQPNPHGLPKIIDFIFGRFESSWFQVGRKERVARGETPHSGGFQPYSRVLPRLLRGARGRIARVIAGGACPGRPGGRVGRGKSRTLSWAVTQRKHILWDIFRPDTRYLSNGPKIFQGF